MLRNNSNQELSIYLESDCWMEPGVGDIGLEGAGLSSFLRLHESVVGTVFQLRQPQHEQSARILLDACYQHVISVFTLLLRPTVRITRWTVAASLVVVPNNWPKHLFKSFMRITQQEVGSFSNNTAIDITVCLCMRIFQPLPNLLTPVLKLNTFHNFDVDVDVYLLKQHWINHSRWQ